MWALVGDLCANFDPFFPENSFDKEIASFPIRMYFICKYLKKERNPTSTKKKKKKEKFFV